MEKNINQTVLKNCYKNEKMDLLSLDEVITKNQNPLKDELISQHEEYNEHLAKIAITAAKLGVEIPEINAVTKGMLNASINFKTMADDSNSHIAEMTLKGTVTGYTTLIKDLSEYGPLLNEEVVVCVEQLKEFEERCEQNLKKYL